MKRLALILLLASTPALGADIDQLQNLAQGEFRLLSEDLGGALSYRAQTPTEPLGTIGFDFGVAVTAVKLEHVGVFDKATSDSANATLPVPTLRLNKGLPLGVDIGVMYAAVPNSNIRYYGGELRYAIVDGGVALPSVGIRGSITKLTGVDQLDLSTRGVDLSISKGIGFVTPYAGIGKVWVKSEPRADAGFLASEEFSMSRVFLGLGINLLASNLNFEADKTGDVTGYSIKIGFRF
ncbi:MAG TPA: hypothetical protein VML57_00530 [Burkholderiales bacterium]|jgi:hypothetical protein|nr:hypothetical protein [Burkholderiales bacterium]